MPIYQYRHPEQPIVIDIFQKMNEPHVYTDDEGVEWIRVWSVPNASVDSLANDPWSSKDFKKNTEQKNCTMGELWDRSKELSDMRKSQNNGVDPIKEKYEKQYSEKRHGRQHKETESDN